VARGHQGRGLSPDAVQKQGFWENKAMSLCASLHYKRWYRRVLPVCALPPPKIVSQLSGLCTYFSKKLRRVGTEAKVGLVVGRNRFLPSADPPSLSCLSELQYRNKLFLEISKEETRTRCARQTVCSVCPYGKKKKISRARIWSLIKGVERTARTVVINSSFYSLHPTSDILYYES